MSKISYEVRITEVSYEYRLASIRVFNSDYLGLVRRPILTFDWQMTIKEPQRGWYGGDLKIEARSFEQVKEAYNLARKLIGKLDWQDLTVDRILTQLERVKAVQVVYDDRLHERVPIDKVPPPNLIRFLDNYNVYDNGAASTGVKYDALAEDEKSAKKSILAQAVEQNDTDFITRFIAADQPVFCGNGKLPDTTPARVLLSLEEVESE